jgi:pyrimidine operon attenuation protein/uracil phosphoribosyltransferase
MPKNSTVKIMNDKAIERSLTRVSHEIIERNSGIENVCIIGIRTRGAIIAERLANILNQITDTEIPVGIIDITLYRDDIQDMLDQPLVQKTDILFNIAGKTIVLVDDVLYTGRTVRAALDAIVDLGRPESIQLAVLVDRGHRELPIRADYTGREVPTSSKERVEVHLKEHDGKEEVIIDRSGRGGV